MTLGTPDPNQSGTPDPDQSGTPDPDQSETPDPNQSDITAFEEIEGQIIRPLKEKEKKDLDIGQQRETTRSSLALWLIRIFAGTYVFCFILITILTFPWEEKNSPNVSEVDDKLENIKKEKRQERYTYSKDMITILLTTQTGIIGTALGFYFGSKEDNKKENKNNNN